MYVSIQEYKIEQVEQRAVFFLGKHCNTPDVGESMYYCKNLGGYELQGIKGHIERGIGKNIERTARSAHRVPFSRRDRTAEGRARGTSGAEDDCAHPYSS